MSNINRALRLPATTSIEGLSDQTVALLLTDLVERHRGGYPWTEDELIAERTLYGLMQDRAEPAPVSAPAPAPWRTNGRVIDDLNATLTRWFREQGIETTNAQMHAAACAALDQVSHLPVV